MCKGVCCLINLSHAYQTPTACHTLKLEVNETGTVDHIWMRGIVEHLSCCATSESPRKCLCVLQTMSPSVVLMCVGLKAGESRLFHKGGLTRSRSVCPQPNTRQTVPIRKREPGTRFSVKLLVLRRSELSKKLPNHHQVQTSYSRGLGGNRIGR